MAVTHCIYKKVHPWSTNKTQCPAVHYFNRASADKQFCQLTVALVESLTARPVETLSNLRFFFSMKAKFDFFTSISSKSIIKISL